MGVGVGGGGTYSFPRLADKKRGDGISRLQTAPVNSLEIISAQLWHGYWRITLKSDDVFIRDALDCY